MKPLTRRLQQRDYLRRRAEVTFTVAEELDIPAGLTALEAAWWAPTARGGAEPHPDDDSAPRGRYAPPCRLCGAPRGLDGECHHEAHP